MFGKLISSAIKVVTLPVDAANEPRMTLPTAAPTHSEIAWYVRELTEAKAREEKMLAALRLVAKHADFSQCPDGVEEAVDAALLPPNTKT